MLQSTQILLASPAHVRSPWTTSTLGRSMTKFGQMTRCPKSNKSKVASAGEAVRREDRCEGSLHTTKMQARHGARAQPASTTPAPSLIPYRLVERLCRRDRSSRRPVLESGGASSSRRTRWDTGAQSSKRPRLQISPPDAAADEPMPGAPGARCGARSGQLQRSPCSSGRFCKTV